MARYSAAFSGGAPSAVAQQTDARQLGFVLHFLERDRTLEGMEESAPREPSRLPSAVGSGNSSRADLGFADDALPTTL